MFTIAPEKKRVLCFVSDECIIEGLLPTVASESAASSLDSTFRSVCVNTRVCSSGYFILLQCTKPCIVRMPVLAVEIFFNRV